MGLDEVLRSLPANPRIVTSGNHAFPTHLVNEIDDRLDQYHLWVLNAPDGIPDHDGVVLETPFVGPGMRGSSRLSYVPCRLSMVPQLFRTAMAPDLVVLHTTPPRDGKVSLGVEVNVLPAAVDAARARGAKVIAQANPAMPWTFGDGEIDVSMLDLVVDAEASLGPFHASSPDDAAHRIGDLVAARVPDGATLQAGIGAVPDAALLGLRARRGLRIWTEMFSDSVMALEKAGALAADTPIRSSFLFGSPELLAWVDRNPRVRMFRTETVNDPAVIARNPAMVSINTALEVDLFCQANASRIETRIHSGFGGQTDFIVGAMHSYGGQALIALRSWHPRADVSAIVPLIQNPLTSFQMSAIITEQGVAEVYGLDESVQARNIIEHAAHPRVREHLREQAVALGLG